MISLPCSAWVSAAWAQPLPDHSINVPVSVKASSQFQGLGVTLGVPRPIFGFCRRMDSRWQQTRVSLQDPQRLWVALL